MESTQIKISALRLTLNTRYLAFLLLHYYRYGHNSRLSVIGSHALYYQRSGCIWKLIAAMKKPELQWEKLNTALNRNCDRLLFPIVAFSGEMQEKIKYFLKLQCQIISWIRDLVTPSTFQSVRVPTGFSTCWYEALHHLRPNWNSGNCNSLWMAVNRKKVPHPVWQV